MMPILSFLSGWQVKIILVLALAFGAYVWYKAEVKITVNEAVAAIEVQATKENFKLKERALNTQVALQESFNNIQKDKDAKIKTLNARVASLTRSLQERPNRPEPSGVPNSTGIEESKPGATGAQLYRQDGEFLAGEATRAELIKEELIGCYKAYDEAKSTLDKFKMDAQNSPRTH
jgi:nitrogen fixation/metabolism regulation signal transduction histidine kinase